MGEVPNPIQGQPTPDNAAQTPTGLPNTTGEGAEMEPTPNEADALPAVGAREGLLEKPKNDYETFNEWTRRNTERYLAGLTPEQRQQIENDFLEDVKRALGVADSAAFNPQTRRLFEKYKDFFLGKIR